MTTVSQRCVALAQQRDAAPLRCSENALRPLLVGARVVSRPSTRAARRARTLVCQASIGSKSFKLIVPLSDPVDDHDYDDDEEEDDDVEEETHTRIEAVHNDNNDDDDDTVEDYEALKVTIRSHERFDRFIDGLGVAGLVRVDWPDAPAPDDDPILVTDFDDLVPDAAYETFPDLPSSSS